MKLINDAMKCYKPYAVDLTKVEEGQKEKLGRFYRPVPYGRNEDYLNLTMLGHVIPDKQPTTRASVTLSEIVENDIKLSNNKKIVAMVGQSGSGKTATVMDLAFKHFVIYTECTTDSLTVDFGDSNFRILGTDILKSSNELDIKLRKKLENDRENNNTASIRKEHDSKLKCIVGERIRLEYLARQLFLLMLFRLNSNLQPETFFRQQTTDGYSTIKILVKLLKNYDSDTIERMLDYVENTLPSFLKKRGLVIALDEAQVAENNVLSGKFISPIILNSNFLDSRGEVDSNYTRGLLTVLCSTLSKFPATLVILGTSLKLTRVEHVYSSVGKAEERFEMITNFPTCDDSDVQTVLNKVIDMSHCQIPPEKRRNLIGRCQFIISVANALQEIPHSDQNTKQEELDIAIDIAIARNKEALRRNVMKLVREGSLRIKNLLSRMVIASKLTNDRIEFPRIEEADFVNEALCNLKQCSDGYYWVMNEALVLEVVEEVLKLEGIDPEFSEYISHLEKILTNLSTHSLAKGRALKLIVAHALKCFNGKLLKDLPFVKDIPNLPEWCNMIRFQVDEIGTAKELGYSGSVDGDVEFFADPPLNTILLSKNVTRPDIVQLLHKTFVEPTVPDAVLQYWLSVAIKLHSSSLKTVECRSKNTCSDIRHCFLKVNGELNPDQKEARKNFEVCGYPEKIGGIMRIHLLFPRVQGGTPRSCVVGDDVDIYIDGSNIDSFFDEEITKNVDYIHTVKKLINHVICSK